jgi:MFS transporter, DHA1 family, multidrug resistance protein
LNHFGYYQGALAFVFAIGSIIYGFILRHTQYTQKSMLGLSLQLMLLSLIVMTFLTVFNSKKPLVITLGFLLFIVSQIVPSVILYPLSLNLLPHLKARVSALIQGIKLIFTALGLQVASYFYQHTFQSTGTVLIVFMIAAILTLWLVIRNDQLMGIENSIELH